MSSEPSLPTAAGGDADTLFVALELSLRRWGVAFGAADGKISHTTVEGGDLAGLLRTIARVRGRLAGRLQRPVMVRCCYEAGFDGFWLARALIAAGIATWVLDPASLPVDRRRRRVKTDRRDAEMLVRAVMALARGERQAARIVRILTPEQEDRRRRSRERGRLIGERVQHSNRIRGLLMAQGIRGIRPEPRLAGRLDRLITGDGRPLPAQLRREILRELERVALVEHQIAMLEAERDQALATATTSADRRAVQLLAFKGIGPTLATTLVEEAFHRDFANRREVAAYFGLAPAPWASGNTAHEQGITKAGNARARTAMVELAWLWLRHQPATNLARWFHHRVGEARGRVRRVAIVALARKLAVTLWRYLTTGLEPEGAHVAA